MASNPPAACCLTGSLHEGTPSGKISELYGVNTYAVGEKSDKIVVIITDIYGHEFINTQLIADAFARAGYYTLVPDIFSGEAAVYGGAPLDFPTWLPKHGPEATDPIIKGFLTKLKADIDVKFLAGVGHCFGGKYVIRELSAEGFFDVGAIAHPSFASIEEVSAINRPLLISAAENDTIFTPELRKVTEDKLKELKATYEITTFSGTQHGYAVRGDLSIPQVKYAKEKTFNDQLYWFNHFSRSA